MKYWTLLLALVASIAIGANVPNYTEQGGARDVIGGSLDVVSGGDLDIESGGAFKIAGTAVSSSAAELNLLDGVTSTTAELNILDGVTATYAELNLLDGATSSTAELNYVDADSYDDDGIGLKRLVRSEWDATVDGGTSGTAYDLGEDLPANAIVTQNYFQVITQVVDDGSGTIAIHCASADDLFAAADISGSAAGTITDGVATGQAATMFDVGAAACDITLTVAGANASAGKLVHWVEYVVSE